MKRVITLTVSPQYDGKTVDDLLRRAIGVSGSLIKQMKRHSGAILLGGEPVFVTHTVHAGEVLRVTVGFDDEQSENIPARQGALDVVYEDEDILVINKPANLPTHPSHGHYDDSLAGLVLGYYAARGQNFVFRAVNRLDKGTSGLMVIAKHALAHEKLKNQLHTDDFAREYIALVSGAIVSGGRVCAPIKRCTDSVIKRCVAAGGDEAITEYEPLRAADGMTLIKLRLKTGRTHQIRVHMSYIGHPLIGDFLYGEECERIARPALHSAKIALRHPIGGERLEFTAPLPDDIRALLL